MAQGPGPAAQGPGPAAQGPGRAAQGPRPRAWGPGPRARGPGPISSSSVKKTYCARILIEGARFPPFGFAIAEISSNSNEDVSFCQKDLLWPDADRGRSVSPLWVRYSGDKPQMGGHGVGWGAPVQGGVGCPGTYVPLGAPNGGARGRYIKWGVDLRLLIVDPPFNVPGEVHGNPWKSMKFHGIHGNPWRSIEFHGNRWKSMEIHGIHGIPWNSMEIHGIPLIPWIAWPVLSTGFTG